MHSLIVALNSPSDPEQVFFELLTDLTEEKTAAEEIAQVNDKLLRAHQQNTELIAQLEMTARTDALTGIPNRRAFFERAAQEYTRHRRNKTFLTALIVDIDHFKSINDNYGHGVGDRALIAVAKLLGRNLRNHDVLGRIGGEEFAILLTDSLPEGARLTAQRLITAVNKEPVLFLEQKPLMMTISIGLSVIRAEDTLESALDRADLALYDAKKSGRNRVSMTE